MRNFTMGVLGLVTTLTVVTSAVGPDVKYNAPRNENGQPDLRGVWNFSSDVPLQRPASFADQKQFTAEEFEKRRTARRNILSLVTTFAPVEAVGLDWLDTRVRVEDLRTSLISYPDNGRLPKLVEGVRRFPGVDDIIELLTDATRRIIPIDGRPNVGDKLRSWSGDSRGHWEGDTLIVETRNFSTRPQSFDGAGSAHDKLVVERFTRTSNDRLAYEATITDTKTSRTRSCWRLGWRRSMRGRMNGPATKGTTACRMRCPAHASKNAQPPRKPAEESQGKRTSPSDVLSFNLEVELQTELGEARRHL